MEHTKLLIIGAGPYGLSTAACAKGWELDPVVLGEPMGFWRHNMPEGMLLRSGVDWQLDPFEVHTFRAFLRSRDLDENGNVISREVTASAPSSCIGAFLGSVSFSRSRNAL